jgi:tetratricopeptide (TPR) repeat protein
MTVGCVSDPATGDAPGFPWVTISDVPQSRKQLKDASGLDLRYAQWQEQMGNMSEAREGYSRVLKAQPKSMDARLGLARLDQLAGNTAAAEEAYRQIAQDAAGDAQALDALAQFYVAEHRLPEAISTLQEAVKAAPEDTVCRYHLAVALAKSGETARAFAEFSKTVDEAEAHYNVGYICYEEGRKDIAEREFLQAITLRPDLKSAQTMLDELRGGRTMPRQALQASAATPNATAPRRPPLVTQTVATLPPDIPHYVNPASATVPAEPTDADAKSSQPIWQMPSRREPSSVFTEQMQNQTKS